MISDSEPREPRIITGEKGTMSRRKTVGEAALAGVLTPKHDSLQPSQPSRIVLSGERAEQSRVGERLGYLGTISDLRFATARTELQNWQTLLSGEIPEVSGGGVHPRGKLCIARAGASHAKGVISFGGAIESGADYKGLAREIPTKHYKFYHSFGNLASSEGYLTEVIRRANEQGLSLKLKAFDHAYDGMNIYTYHFKEMYEIINGAYGQFPDAWMDTEHFLQGKIQGVSEKHIGWVQEPIAGMGQRSHSGRMGQIGAALDEGGFSESAYRQGCEQAGVLPDMPWLLAPEFEQALVAKAAARE